MRLRTSVTLGILCVGVPACGMPTKLVAQQIECDPELKQPANDADGYHLRGDRCEGIYIKEVAGRFQVASFTATFDDYDLPSSGKDLLLRLRWPSFGDATVNLRASGLRTHLYYRMDTVRAPSATSYAWQTSLLSKYQLSRSDLGVVAWTTHLLGSQRRDIYLPLQITQQPGGGAPPGSYELVLLPDVQLSAVFVTVASIGEDGMPRTYLKKDENLERSYYPAQGKLPIKISNLSAPGIYYVEVGATLQHGGSSTVGLWFYHPGG